MQTVIQTDNYPDQRIRITLNTVDVMVRLRYSNIASCWFFDVMTAEGTGISLGRRIKSGYKILPSDSLIDGINGNFMAVPISISEEEIGIKPWGNSHNLAFYETDV